MPLTVHGEVQVDSVGRKAKVTIEGATPGAVGSSEAKSLALRAGSQHVHNCGISGQSGPYPIDPATGRAFNPYPVDPDGNALPIVPPPRGAKYRQDFDIQAGM
jgi:hypothetical protein